MEPDSLIWVCALNKIFAHRCRVGMKLLEYFGSASEVFRQSSDTLGSLLGWKNEVVSRIKDPGITEWARREVEWAWKNNVKLIPAGSKDYPYRLAECEDAPLMLYCRGNVDLNASRVLSVVGTRRCSLYGRSCCKSIIESLSRIRPAPLIVSGMALGIDGCAHLSAMEAGLDTVGVMPCGPDDIYPRQHRDLAGKVVEHGALITDFCRGTPPLAASFVSRNRIIAGLADAVLLVESYAKGGGLITVSLAQSYGREVFSVPGRMNDDSFQGCIKTISSNLAQIVTSPDDVGVAMGWSSRFGAGSGTSLFRGDDSQLKKSVLAALKQHSPLGMEDLAARCGRSVSEISSILLELELDGRVSSSGGNFLLSL